MRSEEPWLLAFPYPLALPISSLSLILKGILAKEEESIVNLQTCRKKNIEHHSTGFPNWVPGYTKLSSLYKPLRG
jgi:hypothetical protein